MIPIIFHLCAYILLCNGHMKRAVKCLLHIRQVVMTASRNKLTEAMLKEYVWRGNEDITV